MKVVNSHNAIVLELETTASSTTTTAMTFDKENIAAQSDIIALVKHAGLEGTPVYIRRVESGAVHMWPVILCTNTTMRAVGFAASNSRMLMVVVS